MPALGSIKLIVQMQMESEAWEFWFNSSLCKNVSGLLIILESSVQESIKVIFLNVGLEKPS